MQKGLDLAGPRAYPLGVGREMMVPGRFYRVRFRVALEGGGAKEITRRVKVARVTNGVIVANAVKKDGDTETKPGAIELCMFDEKDLVACAPLEMDLFYGELVPEGTAKIAARRPA